MRNIHVLPTDKPSRLHLWYDGEKLSIETCELEYSHTRNIQHIYITSEEQAKEGHWGYIPFEGGTVKLVGQYFADDWKKIILTTDQDLIADGVQAIDDDFLEWFVKNPNCEYIPTPIIELCENCGQQFCDNGNCRGWGDKSYYLLAYPESISEKTITYCDGYEVNLKEIIIPQEEPKLIKCYCGHTTTCDCEPQEVNEKSYLTFTSNEETPVNIHMRVLPEFDSASKQETIEEAAENEFSLLDTENDRTGEIEEENLQLLGHRKSFIKGAKSDAARDYWFAQFKEMIDKEIDKVSDLSLTYCKQGDQKSSEKWINYYLAYKKVIKLLETKK
jgi:hypothetical protein